MTDMTMDAAVSRGLATRGSSGDAIYRAAASLLRRHGARGRLVDVGCGTGQFRDAAGDLATGYVGVDVVRHPGLAANVECLTANLDAEPIPLAAESADVVAAIETIEHLENPRRFWRELARILKPGGWVVVTTPNQTSLLSLISLAVRGRFPAFTDSYYPIHCTALLPNDLVRMARECGLTSPELAYSASGRVPLLPLHYPAALSRLFPGALSDNVLLIARKPAA
jgi:2-polyprenyl-3-methyl-5-hydroxy-6-metoxy-1,4-benzoquinol methylase